MYMGYSIIVSGFTGNFEYVNGNYEFIGLENEKPLYRNGEEDGDIVLFVSWSSDFNRWDIYGDVNGQSYDFAVLEEDVAFPWQSENWVIVDPYTVYDSVLDEDVEVTVTGENITVESEYPLCTTLSSFFISGANNNVLQNGNISWNNLSWEEFTFENSDISTEQYYQAWLTTWFPDGVGGLANYLFLVGPKLSGEPVFEIYNTTFGTEGYIVSGDGPIITSDPFVGPGPTCPNSVSWPGEPNIQFTLAPPEPEPVPSNELPLTFEQVANLHGSIVNFLRLRNLGYF
jgi:hypothetical protein